MPNQPTQPTQFYGFAPKRRHFIWRNPEEVEPPAAETASATSAAVEVSAPTGAEVAAATERAVASSTEFVADEVCPATDAPAAPATTEAIVLVEPAPEIAVETVPDAPPAEHRRKRNSPRRKKRNRRKQGRKTVREEPQSPSPNMHEAQCMICRSKWREEMDELFVNWHNVSEIGREYNTPRRVIYRHANAVGLFPIRDRNLRRSLGLIIHRAETVPGVTADSVIRAVRTLAHVNDAGEWVQPPAHVVFSTVPRRTDEVRSPEQSRGALQANCAAPSAPKLLDTPCQAIESVKP
jgi:hypothetical protein